MTAPSTTGPGALSTELRARTAAAHAGAETSAFFTALATGQVTRAQTAGLAVRLLPVYEALETAARVWADDPIVGPLVVPGLERADRLRADLRALGVPASPVSPAAAQYAARVAQVAPLSRPAFVAHHYTRYLGDLSGGQVIRAALERSLGLTDGAGASFFAFPDVRPGALKKRYRELLDQAPFSPQQREELIAEVLVAYRLNVALGAELDRDVPRWTTA